MTEALVVFGLVALLVVLGTLAVSVSLEVLVLAGAVCIGLGFLVGLPAGVLYHLWLYRCLARRGPVPRAFIWQPTRYHAALTDGELKRVMRPFVVGALGFALVLIGSVIFMLGFLRT